MIEIQSIRDIPVLVVEGVEHPDINLVPLWDIEVGDKIKQIGTYSKNGKETSRHRVDAFHTFATYSGCVEAEGNKWALFKVNEDEVLDSDQSPASITVYLAYIIKDKFKELWQPREQLLNVYTYIGYIKL